MWNPRVVLLIFFTTILYYAKASSNAKKKSVGQGKSWMKPIEARVPSNGSLCSLSEMRKSGSKKSKYYECVILDPKTRKDFKLIGVGMWQIEECKGDTQFVEIQQRCLSRRNIRRQQANCAIKPSLGGCGICDAPPGATPAVGNACSFQTAPLSPNPYSPSSYLQCAQTAPGAPCGVFQNMPCAADSVFNVQLGICVPQFPAPAPVPVPLPGPRPGPYPVPGPLPAPAPASCGLNSVLIGPCVNSACPANCGCDQGICCCPVAAPTVTCPLPAPVLCPRPPPVQCPPPPPIQCPVPHPPRCPPPPPVQCPLPPPVQCPPPPPIQCPRAPPIQCPPPQPIPCPRPPPVQCPAAPPIQCPAPPPIQCPAPQPCVCPQPPPCICPRAPPQPVPVCPPPPLPRPCCVQPPPPRQPPVCWTGKMAITVCGTSRACPFGTSCQGGGCCPRRRSRKLPTQKKSEQGD